jgi:hypothetical protein
MRFNRDFDVPKPTFVDSSAATCAASGLIVSKKKVSSVGNHKAEWRIIIQTLHQLIGTQSPYLEAVMPLLKATLRDCSAHSQRRQRDDTRRGRTSQRNDSLYHHQHPHHSNMNNYSMIGTAGENARPQEIARRFSDGNMYKR